MMMFPYLILDFINLLTPIPKAHPYGSYYCLKVLFELEHCELVWQYRLSYGLLVHHNKTMKRNADHACFSFTFNSFEYFSISVPDIAPCYASCFTVIYILVLIYCTL